MRPIRCLALACALVAVPAWAVTDHLRCYKVRNLTLDGLAGGVDLGSPELGFTPLCRLKKTALYCIPTTKEVVPGTLRNGQTFFTPLPFAAPPARARLCYPLKCPSTGPWPPLTVTDQFGTHSLVRGPTQLVCTPAQAGDGWCGNGLLEAGEACEGANLNGATCESLGRPPGTLSCTPGCELDVGECGVPSMLASGQTLCWDIAPTPTVPIPCTGTGQDGEFHAGVPLAYTANPDGTITDVNTNLQWEALTDDDSIHDWDNLYDWDQAFAKVAALNASAFAQKTDWRLPNLRELKSIVDYGTHSPAVAPEFHSNCSGGCTDCSCTANAHYRTSTSYGPNGNDAWLVIFTTGWAAVHGKPLPLRVRAVRGGL
jgi:hypothetical protein